MSVFGLRKHVLRWEVIKDSKRGRFYVLQLVDYGATGDAEQFCFHTIHIDGQSHTLDTFSRSKSVVCELDWKH